MLRFLLAEVPFIDKEMCEKKKRPENGQIPVFIINCWKNNRKTVRAGIGIIFLGARKLPIVV